MSLLFLAGILAFFCTGCDWPIRLPFGLDFEENPLINNDEDPEEYSVTFQVLDFEENPWRGLKLLLLLKR